VRKKSEVLATRPIGPYRWLACENPGPTPRPGQFYMLASVERWGGGEGERPFLPRAFSYLRTDGDRLEFLWEDVGPGTRRLSELRPGEDLWLLGPLGNGFEPAPNPLLVGGGIGIVPIAGWQDELGDAPVLLGFRDAHHAAAAELLRAPRIATDDGSLGHHGFVTELLAAELGDVTVYACGPPPMLETVRAICAERDVPAQLALEAGMACGFGACFGCVVPTRDGYVRLCVDGPVLEATALEGVR
jgi:dihydroorotate dehydrogenase electron transfer subunit